MQGSTMQLHREGINLMMTSKKEQVGRENESSFCPYGEHNLNDLLSHFQDQNEQSSFLHIMDWKVHLLF